MTTIQLMSNLGTILRSMTKHFMKVIEEGTDLSLICRFYIVFHHFLFKTEFLPHQNTMMTNTSGKVRKVKTSKLWRMNQFMILSVKKKSLSIWKKIFENFSKRRKSMTWSKKFRIFWFTINIYSEKTKKEEINEE
jgi:hypothetical protein